MVLAASYEAKVHGVSGGMPGWRARQLCPRILFVRGHFGEYQRLADAVVDLFYDLTPAVERISIDEAFLDVSGATHLFGPPEVIAESLRRRVRGEVGLPISVGVARTKHLAKVASQVAKPDGLVVVEPDAELAFLDPLPVSLMWGVGPVAQQRLAGRGIRTIGDLAREPSTSIEHLLGRAVGARLNALAVNDDPRRVATSSRARSVGAQSALGRRRPTRELVREVLTYLADRVAGRLRAHQRGARTIGVRVRFTGMRSVTRATTLPAPLAATLTLTEIAEQLVWNAIHDQGDPGPRDHPPRDLDVQPRPRARAAVRAAPPARRPAPGRFGERIGPVGPRPLDGRRAPPVRQGRDRLPSRDHAPARRPGGVPRAGRARPVTRRRAGADRQVMPRANQPLHPPEASHQALRTSPSGPTAKTSRCSVTRVKAATWLPGFAVPPEMLNHAAQPVVSCHQVL